MKQICAEHAIRWLPHRYHHRPRLLATSWDFAIFVVIALREAIAIRADLIHARSYIPTFVAMLVGFLTGKPFIFDMRAFWPDEMVAAGRMAHESLLFRVIKSLERLCLRRAAAVVSLTEVGVAHMRHVYSPLLDNTRFAVIPTCVDLERFQPAGPAPGLTTIGSVGTVLSGWFRFSWLASFLRELCDAERTVRVRIITTEDETVIRRSLHEAGVPLTRLEVFGVSPSGVPQAVADLSAVAMFFETGVSKLGSCPTRMGEILATGRPVVANPGVGDVGDIIQRYRVGVLVEENTEESMRSAVAALKALLEDPELPARCRRAAEDWFSLEKGAATYAQIYREAERA
jgi:glycosyltransferase involved in cell wall biosynthesis